MLREQLNCVVMDTETTGLGPSKGHRLVEIATVEIVAGAIVGEGWSSLINPGRGITVEATKVHGITDAMVAQAPDAKGIAAGLHFRLGTKPLAFHNSPFDLPFVVQFFADAGLTMQTVPVIDTLGLARGMNANGSNKLIDCIIRHGIPQETAHRALGDTRMTAKLLLVLVDLYEQRGFSTIDSLAAHSQDVMRQTASRFRGRR